MNVANILPERPHRGRAALHRAARADRRRLRARLPDGRRAALLERDARAKARERTSSSQNPYAQAVHGADATRSTSTSPSPPACRSRQLESPSHAIRRRTARQHDRDRSRSTPGETGGNRDFILRYRLAGDDIQSGLLLFPGAEGELLPADGAAAAPPGAEMIPPREYVFIVDVSGSMNGFPLDTTKALMRELLGRLRPTDRFNVLLFSGGSRLFAAASVDADKDEHRRRDRVHRSRARRRRHRAAARARARDGAAASREGRVAQLRGRDRRLHRARRPRCSSSSATQLGDANVFAFGIGSREPPPHRGHREGRPRRAVRRSSTRRRREGGRRSSARTSSRRC